MGFWSNPIIYHLIVDRFNCEDFVRREEHFSVGHFFGGNFRGITSKVESGYFDALGVNALLISAPYQQILGWVPGGGGRFRHYGYHGYYAHDFTAIESRLGTEDDLLHLSRTCHAHGIALLLDIVLNHPGYEEPQSLDASGINVLSSGWRSASIDTQHSYIEYEKGDFSGWWGPDWIRANLPGHSPGGSDERTALLYGLPDFKTESELTVSLPEFLKTKSDTRAIDLPDTTVAGYLVHWVTDWISRCEIDGFRCDSAGHVDLDTWIKLKVDAEDKYQSMNYGKGEKKFWMLGEVWGHGIAYSEYYDFGFDALLNFDFQNEIASGNTLSTIHKKYAQTLSGRRDSLPVSYLSSQDTYLFDRSSLKQGALALMLAPGGIEIFYGDESCRQPGDACDGDVSQANRSPMNWNTIDMELLAYWRTLGTFRRKHIAIAQGEHSTLSLDPYVFIRRHEESGDLVLVAIDVPRPLRVDVSGFSIDNVRLRDHVSGVYSGVIKGSLEISPAHLQLFELA